MQKSCASLSSAPLSELLNPAPSFDEALLSGFALGKDGKIKKKRGRKPTPGLTDEGRRQARLLKNRRTAETSRRRKVALLHTLEKERDEAKREAAVLRGRNFLLIQRLADALNVSVDVVRGMEGAFSEESSRLRFVHSEDSENDEQHNEHGEGHDRNDHEKMFSE